MRDKNKIYETPGFEILTFEQGEIFTLNVQDSYDPKDDSGDDWGGFINP